jgi:Outer membrane protein beta-barrel domain
MKTKFWIIVLFLAASASAQAQHKGFMVGIKGGANLSTLSMGNFLTTRYNTNGVPMLNYNGQVVSDNLRQSLDSQTGYAGGVFMRFGRNLYIQPELLFSTKRATFEVVKNDRPDRPTIEEVSTTINTIDLPVLIGLKGGPFRINAGPVASLRVGQNQSYREAIQQYTAGSANDALAQTMWGYQVGGGIDLGRLSLDVRREGMLSDLASIQTDNAPLRQKLNSWQVTVGLKIF